MVTRRKTTPSNPSTSSGPSTPGPVNRKTSVDAPTAATDTGLGDVGAYMTDAWQRTFLFWDTLLNRGNNYLEHLDQGTPPLLKFEHEVVLDGKTLAQPCNYALLRLMPPASMPVNPDVRPVVVVDPRAGHGPGIGGFKMDSEVGMAMHAGHTVYFVTFRPEPEGAAEAFARRMTIA